VDTWEKIYFGVGIMWFVISYVINIPGLVLVGLTFLFLSYAMYKGRKG